MLAPGYLVLCSDYVTDWMAEESQFDSWQRQDFFLITSKSALEPTQRPLHWVPVSVYSGLKQQRLEADHSLVHGMVLNLLSPG
jgi:hypothetical protein